MRGIESERTREMMERAQEAAIFFHGPKTSKQCLDFIVNNSRFAVKIQTWAAKL
jgi:hypothetical protein